MRRSTVELRVAGLQELVDRGVGLYVRAVVDEVADWNTRGKFNETAVMVSVPVRDHQMIDLSNAGGTRRRHDAISISRRADEISGIDQQRLPGRRHEQRRVATFDIDDVD